MKKPLHELSDAYLAKRLDEMKREVSRRAEAHKANGDRGIPIKGLEYPKRAIVIAAAGGHSIVFIGSQGTGKSMLRGLAYALGARESYECLPCPCGNLGNARKACKCELKDIEKHKRKIPVADIAIEVCQVSEHEMNARLPGTSQAQMKEQVDRAKLQPVPSRQLDQEEKNLLGYAVSELGLSAAQRNTILNVAITVARVNGNRSITVADLTEAIGYRTLVR